MNTGIKRSMTSDHDGKVVEFLMKIPIDSIFANPETSDFYYKMQRGFRDRDSEMLLIMAKMVRSIEENFNGGLA